MVSCKSLVSAMAQPQPHVLRPRPACLITRTQSLPQQPPDRFRLARLWIGLGFDPGVELRFLVGVEAQADALADPGGRAAHLLFLTLGYCSPLNIPLSISRTGAGIRPPAPALTTHALLRRRLMAAGQLKRSVGRVLGAAKPRLDVERDRSASGGSPRRPSGADSTYCSRMLRIRFAVCGRLR